MAKEIEPVRVVIDFTDNEIRTVTSDKPLNVVVTSFDDATLQDTLKTHDEGDLPVIPNDLNDLEDGRSAGVFDLFVSEVDKEVVDDTFGYVSDPAKVSKFSKIVIQALEEDKGAEDE